MNKIKPQSGPVNQYEILLKKDNEWLYFSNPYLVVTAEKPEDVLPVLQEIERLIAINDWYAAGFLSYETAPAFDSALRTQPGAGFPYLWFGLYPQPVTITLPSPGEARPVLDWQPTVDRETYNSCSADRNFNRALSMQVHYRGTENQHDENYYRVGKHSAQDLYGYHWIYIATAGSQL